MTVAAVDGRIWTIVIASDSEAIQTRLQRQTLSLDGFPPDLIRGLLAVTVKWLVTASQAF